MEDSLDKLGTVLAVTNQINRDALELLRESQEQLAEQQKRQTEILTTAMQLAGGAFIIVLVAIVLAFFSFNNLQSRVQKNTEAICYGQPEAISERLSPQQQPY